MITKEGIAAHHTMSMERREHLIQWKSLLEVKDSFSLSLFRIDLRKETKFCGSRSSRTRTTAPQHIFAFFLIFFRCTNPLLHTFFFPLSLFSSFLHYHPFPSIHPVIHSNSILPSLFFSLIQ